MQAAASDVGSGKPASLSKTKNETNPAFPVQAHRLSVNGYSATDIVSLAGQDGRRVLYIPGEAEPFHEFKNEDELKNWVARRVQDSAAREDLSSHFSVYDRSKGKFGIFSATGVDEALDNIASGKWGEDSIDVKSKVIHGDIFSDMGEQIGKRTRNDLLEIIHDNDRRNLWLDDVKKTSPMPLTRPVARALAAGTIAAEIAASGSRASVADTAKGREDSHDVYSSDSMKQTEFRPVEFQEGQAADTVNEINVRIRSITGQQRLQTYDSMTALGQSSSATEDKTGFERIRNSLDEVYRRLNAAKERLQDPEQKDQILDDLGKSLNTTDRSVQTQAYDRLQGMAQQAFERFAALRNYDYRNVTFFERPDKSQSVPEEEEKNPVLAFVNMKDRRRLMINLEGPDKGRHTLSDSEASRGYNIELVDSVMNQMTRLARNTQDYMNVSREATRDGFSLGTAANALEQIQHGPVNDALAQRVLGKAPDIPDDAWIRKVQGLKNDEPVTNDMRGAARDKYVGMDARARKDTGEPASWTFLDSDRDEVSGRIRGDAMLRADLMTSNADTAALYLRDIGTRRSCNTPLPGAESQRGLLYGVEDLEGTHFFATQQEAKTYADGEFKRGFSGGVKNPLGATLKIIGWVSGASPGTEKRLAEIGDNPIGELFALTGKAFGTSENVQDKLKAIGGTAEYLVPVWGTARLIGKIVGNSMDGTSPSPDDLINILGDLKHMPSDVVRNTMPEPKSGDIAPETKPEAKPSEEIRKPVDRDSTRGSTPPPSPGETEPRFKPPGKLPDGRTGYLADPEKMPRLPEKDTGIPDGSTGLNIQLNVDNVNRELPGLTEQGRQNAARYLGDSKNPAPVINNPQAIENATRFFNEGAKLVLQGGAPGGDGPSQPKRPRLNVDDGQQPSTSGVAGTVYRGIFIPDTLRNSILDTIRKNPRLANNTIAKMVNVPVQVIAELRESYGLKRIRGRGTSLAPELRAQVIGYIHGHLEESDADIANRFNISWTLVRTIRQELRLFKALPSISAERKVQLVDYIRSNINEVDENIARRFGVSRSTVNRLRYQNRLQKTVGAGVPLTAERKTEIREFMRNNPNRTIDDIATRFEISTMTVKRIRKDPRFVEAPAPVPSPLPEGLDLYAPLSPDSQQKVNEIQRTLPGAQPDATGGSPASTPSSSESGLSQYVGDDAPEAESLERNLHLVWDELLWINPDELTNERMMRWLAKTLTPEEVQRLADLPDSQVESEFGLLRQRANLPEAGVAPTPPATPSGAPPATSPGSSSQPSQGNVDEPQTQPGEQQRAQLQQELDSSPTPPADANEVIEWLQTHRSAQEIDRILTLSPGEFDAAIAQARREMQMALTQNAALEP